MPSWLAWLRKKTSKRPATPCAVDAAAVLPDQGSVKMPGVGMIDLESTRKTRHDASLVVGEHGEELLPAGVDGLLPATVCPKAALVRPRSGVSITELRLGPNKAPCCLILTEDIESYTPPKPCRSSR